MKTHRALVTTVLCFLVASAASLVSWSAPALAGPATTVVLGISGTVDGSPESISFAGQAQITSTVVSDPIAGTPTGVLLAIDFQNVSGVGLSTGATYVSTAQDRVLREVIASDEVAIPFPLFPRGANDFSSGRSALASFTLIFDPITGQLTGGLATITTPNF